MNQSVSTIFTTGNKCRSCGSISLETILELGKIPLADALVDRIDLSEDEVKIDATLVFCTHCFLLQLKEDVHPHILFNQNYPYYTSVSPEVRAHFQETAERIHSMMSFSMPPKVVEAASNDGFLLSILQSKGCEVLGIEPSGGPAESAIQNGIPTDISFFNTEFAKNYLSKNEPVDFFLANNVVAHVPDPNDFVSAIRMMIEENGIAEFEFPWALATISNQQFDQIFHQHYSYFSLHSFLILLRKNGLFILNAEKILIHGGSLRIFAASGGEPSDSVIQILKEERNAGMLNIEFYKKFSEKVMESRNEFFRLLKKLKDEGKRIGGYGAAAKANTLLTFSQTADFIDWIADISPYKQGKYFPVNHLLIISLEELKSNPPDYLVIFAWNFAPSIMEQLNWFSMAGGKFIIPVPFPVVV